MHPAPKLFCSQAVETLGCYTFHFALMLFFVVVVKQALITILPIKLSFQNAAAIMCILANFELVLLRAVTDLLLEQMLDALSLVCGTLAILHLS